MVSQHPLPAEIQDQLFCALGQAVAKVWSQLPQEIQHHLFEEAVASQGEPVRQQIAVFLQHKQQRTADAVNAQALLKPDSRGG
jgi:hypothetical protein